MNDDEGRMEHDKKMNLAEENYEPATETEKHILAAKVKKYLEGLKNKYQN